MDTENSVPAEMMRFAKKLDDKTNPYSIRGKRSLTETRELLDELDYLGVIRRALSRMVMDSI